MGRKLKVAFISGANRGLGLGCALEFTKDHAVVFGVRDPEAFKYNAHFEAMREKNPDCMMVRFEANDLSTVVAAIHQTIARFGKIDVLINNAGVRIDTTTPEAIQESFRVNALAPFATCQNVLPLMNLNGYGRIVNVSSLMGQLSGMGGDVPAYRISKTAMNAVTKIFASKVIGDVQINSVCPGWVRTAMGGETASSSLEDGVKRILDVVRLPAGAPNGVFFRDGKVIEW